RRHLRTLLQRDLPGPTWRGYCTWSTASGEDLLRQGCKRTLTSGSSDNRRNDSEPLSVLASETSGRSTRETKAGATVHAARRLDYRRPGSLGGSGISSRYHGSRNK